MIYTCTMNPSLDYWLEVEQFNINDLSRSSKETYLVGGKGINVSICLARLNKEHQTLGFVGGFTGEYIKQQLEREHVNTDFITVDENTRINVKIKNNKDITDLSGNGPFISSSQFDSLLEQVKQLMSKDLFVLSGSVPSSLGDTCYEDLAQICSLNQVPFVVDSNTTYLMQTLKYKPVLVKPNHLELGEIFNVEIQSVEDVVKYGKQLLSLGALNVIVSMGKDGAVLITPNVILRGIAPKITVKNTVGAGDSLVAGFVYAYCNGFTIEECFRYGIACGSASVSSEFLLTKEKVNELLPLVEINSLV